MGLILNPLVKLKPNKAKSLIYKYDSFTFSPDKVNVIDPMYAVLLTLFDGTKSYDEIIQDFCFVIDQEPNEQNRAVIQQHLQKIEKEYLDIDHLLVEKDPTNPAHVIRYRPETFVVPADQVKVERMFKRTDFPLTINYNVTSECSQNCIYCYHPKPRFKQLLSLERLDTLFDECAQKGCEHIALSGGDPFDREDIIDIITLLHQKGLTTMISTKNYLDPEKCHRLRYEAGLQHIQISLDDPNPKIAAFLVGLDEGFFDRTVNMVKNLISLGVKVRLKSVLTSYNIDHISDYLELCYQLGVHSVQLVPYGRSIWNHQDAYFPSLEQTQRANEMVAHYKAIHTDGPLIIGGPFQHNYVHSADFDQEAPFKKRGICNAGRTSFTLLPNGEVAICEELPYVPELILGDLSKQSIEEMWNSEKVLQFLTPPPRTKFPEGSPCRTCNDQMYEGCHKILSICLRDSYNYFRNLNSPDARCPFADVQHFRIT